MGGGCLLSSVAAKIGVVQLKLKRGGGNRGLVLRRRCWWKWGGCSPSSSSAEMGGCLPSSLAAKMEVGCSPSPSSLKGKSCSVKSGKMELLRLGGFLLLGGNYGTISSKNV
ncbi:hypothetical protein Salat_0186500 [Sesamum alatum]|uniref:Uncharacterized protein n=1 Tax=Sesamum alatum TaxID=300844 RepID=A0AAE1YYA8_9LAMI|nr:hypothetical protein Salat_0186500 [Sesamum alatum]